MASADSPDTAADVVVDGVLLSDLVAELPLSRSSVFEIIKVLGIKTTTEPGPGGKGRVAWLSSADAEALRDAARRVRQDRVRIADLAQRPQTPRTLQRRSAAPSAYSPDPGDPGPFLARLDAAERAIRSGLGLTTAEVAWILGVKPKADDKQSPADGPPVMIRGGIKATRTGKNCWILERSADSPDAGDSRRVLPPAERRVGFDLAPVVEAKVLSRISLPSW